LGLWRLTAHKISEIFGVRLTRKFRGKLSTVIDHGGALASTLRGWPPALFDGLMGCGA
jgi:hypothetical protein